MKRTILNLLLLTASVLAVPMLSSCEKHESVSTDDDITIKPKDDPEPEDDLSDYDELTSAMALNYGGFWTKDADDYVLLLYSGTLSTSGIFTGKGTAVIIDLLTERSATDYAIAPGEYEITGDDYKKFVFLEGCVQDGEVQPTCIYRQFSSNSSDYDLALVTDGTLTVSCTGSQYTVLCDFYDDDGRNYKYRYEGEIEFSEGEIEEEDDDYDYDSIPQNVVIDNVKKVLAYNLGNIYEDLEDSHYDWEILMTTDNNAEWVCLEFVVDGETDKSVIPDGTYEICQENYLSVGDAVPFVYDEANSYGYGCYYGYGNYYWYGGTKGSVTVARVEDDEYKIDFNVEDETSNGSFKGSYQGDVSIQILNDDTKSASAKKYLKNNSGKNKIRKSAGGPASFSSYGRRKR